MYMIDRTSLPLLFLCNLHYLRPKQLLHQSVMRSVISKGGISRWIVLSISPYRWHLLFVWGEEMHVKSDSSDCINGCYATILLFCVWFHSINFNWYAHVQQRERKAVVVGIWNEGPSSLAGRYRQFSVTFPSLSG